VATPFLTKLTAAVVEIGARSGVPVTHPTVWEWIVARKIEAFQHKGVLYLDSDGIAAAVELARRAGRRPKRSARAVAATIQRVEPGNLEPAA
jgi:hypothetical protein